MGNNPLSIFGTVDHYHICTSVIWGNIIVTHVRFEPKIPRLRGRHLIHYRPPLPLVQYISCLFNLRIQKKMFEEYCNKKRQVNIWSRVKRVERGKNFWDKSIQSRQLHSIKEADIINERCPSYHFSCLFYSVCIYTELLQWNNKTS